MNLLPATLTQIQSHESLHLLTFAFGKEQLTMICLDLPCGITEGEEVTLTVNPSYIALAKHPLSTISCTNQIPATIQEITKGTLLSRIQLQANGIQLESLITTDALHTLDLDVGASIVMVINASEIAIAHGENSC